MPTILPSSSSRDERFSASVASPRSVPAEHPQWRHGHQRSPSISIATSPFTFAPCPRRSSQRSIPLLCLPSEHVKHLQAAVDCVSQMAHLPFRVCNLHCAPHIGHVLSLSSGPGLDVLEFASHLSSAFSDQQQVFLSFPFPDCLKAAFLKAMCVCLAWSGHCCNRLYQHHGDHHQQDSSFGLTFSSATPWRALLTVCLGVSHWSWKIRQMCAICAIATWKIQPTSCTLSLRTSSPSLCMCKDKLCKRRLASMSSFQLTDNGADTLSVVAQNLSLCVQGSQSRDEVRLG